MTQSHTTNQPIAPRKEDSKNDNSDMTYKVEVKHNFIALIVFLFYIFYVSLFVYIIMSLRHGAIWVVCDCGVSRSRGYKTFSMLNSAEHVIYPAHKC